MNIVVPGPTDTPGLRGLASDEAAVAPLLRQQADNTTLARVADPDEVAAAVPFLSTTQSSFTTGSELFADGGEVQTYT